VRDHSNICSRKGPRLLYQGLFLWPFFVAAVYYGVVFIFFERNLVMKNAKLITMFVGFVLAVSPLCPCGPGADKDEDKALDSRPLVKRSVTVPESPEKMEFERSRQAATQGDVQAQYDLGSRYCLGVGVEKDQNKAFEWFKKAGRTGPLYSPIQSWCLL